MPQGIDIVVASTRKGLGTAMVNRGAKMSRLGSGIQELAYIGVATAHRVATVAGRNGASRRRGHTTRLLGNEGHTGGTLANIVLLRAILLDHKRLNSPGGGIGGSPTRRCRAQVEVGSNNHRHQPQHISKHTSHKSPFVMHRASAPQR